MKTTKRLKSKLTNPAFLAKRLNALSDVVWYCYAVGNKLFRDVEPAQRYARRLAKVKGEGVALHRIEVPDALPYKPMYSLAWPEEMTEAESLGSARVYFVLGKPFADEAGAEAEAKRLANETGKAVPVAFADVSLNSLDFQCLQSPDRERPAISIDAA